MIKGSAINPIREAEFSPIERLPQKVQMKLIARLDKKAKIKKSKIKFHSKFPASATIGNKAKMGRQ